jgi:maleylpyruvate isomerase
MKLYTFYRSSCTWRVRIALAYKSVKFEAVPVHLMRAGGEQFDKGFAGKNPQSQVPLLEVTEPDGTVRRLTQSLAILEYLEETVPEPPLLPKEPGMRAEARRIAEIVNSGTQPFQNLELARVLREVNVDAAPITRRYVEQGLTAIERFAEKTAGAYLVGDNVTFADVCVIPQLLGARRFGVDVESYPTIARVEKTCVQHPAFIAAAPQAQPDYEPS